jgi:hypothetical protein
MLFEHKLSLQYHKGTDSNVTHQDSIVNALVQIPTMLNMSDIISEFRNIAMFVR